MTNLTKIDFVLSSLKKDLFDTEITQENIDDAKSILENLAKMKQELDLSIWKLEIEEHNQEEIGQEEAMSQGMPY